MALSSPGIGSGLDINSIVAQLVAIEKQPLQVLKLRSTTIDTKLSAVGQIKGQVSALSDAVTKLATDSNWTKMAVTSSNSSALTATASTSAASSSFSLEVQRLAVARSAVTQTAVDSAATFGTGGTLTFEVGSRNFIPLIAGERTAGPFVAASGTTSVNVTVESADTVTTIAAKINSANAGVTATVVHDDTGDRLLLQSNTTGYDADFKVSVAGDASLDAFAFDNAGGTEMTSATVQQPKDAQATINGVAVTSATDTFAETVPGLTLKAVQVTTAPVTVKIAKDEASIRSNIQGFLNAYNALNKSLSYATKYDSGTKTAGPLQGDSTMVGLQNALRALVGSSSSGSTFQRLSEIGVQMQKDGSLTVNATLFDGAISDVSNLQKLFTADNGYSQNNGFALKMKTFTQGLLALDGQMNSKTNTLQALSASNSKDQDRINAKAALAEVRLRKQYSALDAQLSTLQALNTYVSQQVTSWNKSTG